MRARVGAREGCAGARERYSESIVRIENILLDSNDCELVPTLSNARERVQMIAKSFNGHDMTFELIYMD